MFLFPIAAAADDVGPHPDLRAIRATLPVLLAAQLDKARMDRTHFHTDDVVVDGNDAVAFWEDDVARGIAVVHRRSDLWWLANHDTACQPIPTQRELVERWGLSAKLAALAAQHIAVIDASPAPAPMAVLQQAASVACRPSGSPNDAVDTSDGYVTRFHAPGIAIAPLLLLRGRAPTLAEMPPTSGANSYYFFTLTNTTGNPIHLAGLTLDVWCPFVLDPSLTYGVSALFSDPILVAIDGTLDDNVMHFALPPFTLRPGVELMGVIDGN